jgi:hypothetical protein
MTRPRLVPKRLTAAQRLAAARDVNSVFDATPEEAIEIAKVRARIETAQRDRLTALRSRLDLVSVPIASSSRPRRAQEL